MSDADEGGMLFEVEEVLPDHCIHPKHREAAGPSLCDGPAPRSSFVRHRRLRKWTRDKAGKLVVSLQYQVIAMFAEEGFITSYQIIHHEDDHWRASAKQRIRDCKRFGLEISTDEMGDRYLWRIGTASRARARALVLAADRRGGNKRAEAADRHGGR